MNRPKNPTEKPARKKREPSSKNRKGEPEFERSIPGRRNPSVEKQSERIVNEDEQLKAVNKREDNSQTASASHAEVDRPPAVTQENEIERTEAPYDNSEVNPRPPKVN